MNLFISISICACMGGAGRGRKGERKKAKLGTVKSSTSISPSLFVVALFLSIYLFYFAVKPLALSVRYGRYIYMICIVFLTWEEGLYDNFIYRYGIVSYPTSPEP